MSLSKVEQERLDYAKARLSNKQEEERIINLRHQSLNSQIESLVRAINYLESVRDNPYFKQLFNTLGWEWDKDIIFNYNGRYIKGVFKSCSTTDLTLKLKTPYTGKNVTWDVGQIKHFNLKIITRENVE